MNNKPFFGTPFWTSRDKAPCQYPWLDRDEYCDAVIVGGGFAAAMCAYRFASSGINTAVISADPIGFCATAASVGVVSYQTEDGLTGLAEKTGMDAAVKVYELCAGATDTFEDICSSLGTDVGFSRRDCLYYTDSAAGVQGMKQEYLARRHNGFAVELLDGSSAENMFSFNIKSAVYSPGMAAECDPYLTAHALIKAAADAGARIYENTRVTEILKEKGENVLVCSTSKRVHAKKVILASGTCAADRLGVLAGSRTVFTAVTEPVGDFAGWQGEAVIVSAEKPTVMLRTTPDSRIIISGLECGMTGVVKLAGALKMQGFCTKKQDELRRRLCAMFPGIRNITWAHFYASPNVCTCDNLPVIGPRAEDDSVCFDVCPSGSGMSFAVIAADLLLAHHLGETSPDMYLFSPDR